METYEGLILKGINFKESSKILYLYTAEGPVSLLVHGAKKLLGTLLLVTENLTLIRFSAVGKGLKTFVGGDIVESFRGIKSDLDKFTYAQHLCELVSAFGESEYDHPKLYQFLKKILAKMDGETDYLPFAYMFELKYLYLLGVAPGFSSCGVCGQTEHLRFTVSDGGCVCEPHATSPEFWDAETVLALKRLFYHDLQNPWESNLSPEIRKQIRRFLDDYYSYHLNFISKSRTILGSLLGY